MGNAKPFRAGKDSEDGGAVLWVYLSAVSAAARWTGARWESAHHHNLRRSRTASTERPSSGVSRCLAALCAADGSGAARRFANFYLFSRAAARLAGAGVNAGISADLELRDALWRCPDRAAAVKE